MQHHSPRIPNEIFDDIVDSIANDHPESKSILSNIAFISRRGRQRVNHHRFSTLEVCIHTTPSNFLENLANILCSDLWEQEAGIAPHIRSVCLLLGRRDNRVPSQSDFRDETIADILKTIFKRSGNTPSDQSPRSLTICTARYCHYPNNGPSNGSYNITGLSFDTLGDKTVAVLQDSRSNQYFATLRLERIWNVPSSLLSSSAIKTLYVNHAHFIASNIPSCDLPPPSLVSLETKEASSFVPVVYGGLTSIHTPPISNVKYWLREQEEYGGLKTIGNNAKILDVIVHQYLDVPSAAVNYIESDVLHCLRIETEYDQWYTNTEDEDSPAPDPPTQPIFLGMVHLLPSSPLPVLELSIEASLKYYYLPANICDGLDDVYSRIYHISLVQWLENRCSVTGTHATITLDISFEFYADEDYDPEVFQGTCVPHMRKLLALLGGIEGVELNINISSS